MSGDTADRLSRRDRLRRVALLCCAFARNVAFYRTGMADEAQPLLSQYHRAASFWRQVNSNFFDMAVLEWCKLFGDGSPVATEPKVRFRLETGPSGEVRRTGIDPLRTFNWCEIQVLRNTAKPLP